MNDRNRMYDAVQQQDAEDEELGMCNQCGFEFDEGDLTDGMCDECIDEDWDDDIDADELDAAVEDE